jgi:PAS domain S-box-containing protein
MNTAVATVTTSFPALLRRSFAVFLITLIAIVLTFLLLFGLSLYRTGHATAASQAAALEQYVRRKLEVSAVVADDVLDYLRRRGGMEGLSADERAHQFLSHLSRTANLAEGMIVVDATGTVLLHSDRFPAVPADLSDRTWFQAHLEGVDRVMDGSFISRVTGTLLFVHTFALRDEGGTLLGAVNIGIPSEALLGAQALPFEGRNVVVMVTRETGEILARDPFPEALIGQRLAVPAPVPDGSTLLERRLSDGRWSLTGYSHLRDVGLIASVSIPLWLVLEPVTITATASLPLLALIVAGALWTLRHLEAQQRSLARSNIRLETVLQASNLGAWQWSPKTDQSTYLGRWAEMLGFRPDELEATGVTWRSRLHPDEEQELLADLQRVLSGEQEEFRHEHRLRHKDGHWIWVLDSGQVVERDPDGRPEVLFGIHLDITERREAEEMMRAISLEVDHRSKNLLAVVQALVSMTRMTTEESFKSILRGRILALSRAHDLLSRSRWKGADIRVIAQEELAAYVASRRKNIVIDGPSAVLGASAIQALAMTLHELATNAAKHGALSVPDGKLTLTWTIPASGPSFDIVWTETMELKSAPPAATLGFGSRLISMMVESQLGGTLDTQLTETGLSCRISLPKTLLVSVPHPDTASSPVVDASPKSARSASGARILLVEDDALLAADTKFLLEKAGHVVAASAVNLRRATALAGDADVDAAVLDLNLRGELSLPVADILLARGIPFVFVTGYQRDGIIPARFRGVPVVQKPCPPGEMEKALNEALAIRESHRVSSISSATQA